MLNIVLFVVLSSVCVLFMCVVGMYVSMLSFMLKVWCILSGEMWLWCVRVCMILGMG